MNQVTLNTHRDKLSKDDIHQLTLLLGHHCQLKTKSRLTYALTYGLAGVPRYGILDRVMKEGDTWSYCAGQSYPDEIRTVRNLVLGR